MSERVHDLKGIPVILLGTTVVTGIVDAVSYLTPGHVFTANMAGNLIFLGLATEGVPGLSFSRSLQAFRFFALGAVIETGMTAWWDARRWAFRAFCLESSLLSVAAVISLGFVPPYAGNLFKVQSVIASTAAAMGFRYRDIPQRDCVVRGMVMQLYKSGVNRSRGVYHGSLLEFDGHAVRSR